MKAFLYSSPMITPPPLPYSDESNESLRRDITAFCKRASELARAAALVAGEEPGLLLPQDREDARHRGQAAARRLLLRRSPNTSRRSTASRSSRT